MAETLCQDCLRAQPPIPYPGAADGYTICPDCGGETCPCAGCLESLALLRVGELRGGVLGLQPHVWLVGWTEECGGVFWPEPEVAA